jgi:hypothetical protein
MCHYYNHVKVNKTENWLDELNLSIEKLQRPSLLHHRVIGAD